MQESMYFKDKEDTECVIKCGNANHGQLEDTGEEKLDRIRQREDCEVGISNKLLLGYRIEERRVTREISESDRSKYLLSCIRRVHIGTVWVLSGANEY